MTKHRNQSGWVALLACLLLNMTGVRETLAAELKITGSSGGTASFSQTEFAALPHQDVRVFLEGQAIVFSGIPLTTLLQRVGAPTGKQLRGPALCKVVVVTAKDGYAVTLTLAETDPMFRKEQILVADRADGAPLTEANGPFRLVVEGDLRGARFARMVTEIAVLDVPSCGAPK